MLNYHSCVCITKLRCRRYLNGVNTWVTVGCRYITVQYITILHRTAMSMVEESSYFQDTQKPHIWSSQWYYETIDRVITGLNRTEFGYDIPCSISEIEWFSNPVVCNFKPVSAAMSLDYSHVIQRHRPRESDFNWHVSDSNIRPLCSNGKPGRQYDIFRW